MSWTLFITFLSVALYAKTTNLEYGENNTTIKILTQNIGGADFKFKFFLKPIPVCPVFKLCHSEIKKRIYANILKLQPDIIHFQEAADEIQIKDNKYPLVPNKYQFKCSLGAKGLKEICTAWNKDTMALKTGCSFFNTADSGLLKCSFKKNSVTLTTINLHPSAWDSADRKKLLDTLWSSFVNPKENTIVAGDFNTKNDTYDGRHPYPIEFGTVFGISKKDYGRWPAKKDFYGFYKTTSTADPEIIEVSGSTIFFEKIDHVFSNFGNISDRKISPSICKYSVCPGNHFEYDWGPADWSFFESWGPKIDHLPIWIELTP